MATKIFYTVTPKMESDLARFCQINKISIKSTSEFVIDTLSNLSRDIMKTFEAIKKDNKLTEDELKQTPVIFNGELSKISKDYQLRVFVLTGSGILSGLTLACEVNNAINHRDGRIIYGILDDFIDEYLHNEFGKIAVWLTQYELQQERLQSKKETKVLEKSSKKSKKTNSTSKSESST